jgi:SAM-dependent methyltransferase
MFGPLLDDLPEDIFDPGFAGACERLDHYVGALAREVGRDLSLSPGEPFDADRLMDERGWAPPSRATVEWLLGTLELYGVARRDGHEWLVADLDGHPPSAALRAAAVEADPSVAPAYEVMALAARAVPDVLAGKIRGEEALFGPQTMGLWFSYFSNDNPLYAPSNRIAAAAAARAAGPAPRVLEVGGGGGSAAQEIGRRLVADGKTPWLYHFTELQPAFLRRGARMAQAVLPPATAFKAFRYDINEPPWTQEVEARQYDLVVAVNTVHLARDLPATLAMLRSLLAEGGGLVLGELIRPAGNGTVHLELPFSLLSSYRETAGEGRPAGFLTEAMWRRALHEAGFQQVELLPAQLSRCVEAYPGFYCAALTAR